MDLALAERFRVHLDEAGLLAGPGLALLAVSGGPDSVALLALCAGVAAERRLDLLVVHVDHGMHAHSADVADAVQRTASARFGIATVVERLALGAGATETRARTERYRCFRRLQQERGARWLVTAHHADDQAETVLLRVLRGSAPAGLAGIPVSGPHGLVRPLLPFRREDLAALVRERDLPLFDDPANADERHTRSWVRTRILPLLDARLGAAAREALRSVARHAAHDLVAWDAALEVMPGLEPRIAAGRADVARAALSGYDSALAAQLIRAAARRAGLRVGPSQAARVARLAATAVSGKRLELGDGLAAEASFDRLILSAAQATPEALQVEGEAGEARFGGLAVRWRRDPAPERLAREGWTTWIVPGELEVRLPVRGARMVPLGGNGHRTVARLLMEGRVPRADRAAWPVVVRDGAPLWIPGVCRGQQAVPAPGTLALRMDLAPAE